MPTFGRIAPTVPVADLSRALRFYEGVLGFSVAFTNGNPLSFAVIKQGVAELHLSVQPAKAGSAHAHLMVDDLDGVCERLQQARRYAAAVAETSAVGLARYGGSRPRRKHV